MEQCQGKSPYSPEVRERAVKMFVEHRDEYSSEWAAMTGISARLGMTAETLRSWVRRAEVDQGRRPGLTTDERQRMKDLDMETASCGGPTKS
jgi:transposase